MALRLSRSAATVNCISRAAGVEFCFPPLEGVFAKVGLPRNPLARVATAVVDYAHLCASRISPSSLTGVVNINVRTENGHPWRKFCSQRYTVRTSYVFVAAVGTVGTVVVVQVEALLFRRIGVMDPRQEAACCFCPVASHACFSADDVERFSIQ